METFYSHFFDTYLHFLENSGSIVGDDHVAIRAVKKRCKGTLGVKIWTSEPETYLTSILSMPFGPREVFMRLATVRAAIMLICTLGRNTNSSRMFLELFLAQLEIQTI